MIKEILALILILYYTNSSIVQQSVPQVAFKKNGLLIPNLAYANIKFKVNTTALFNGTNELCNTVSLLKSEAKHLKSKLFTQISRDLEGSCIDNIQKVHEIQEVFGIKNGMYRNVFQHHKNTTKRTHTRHHLERRQVLAGIIMGVTVLLTSLYSIYTTNQLVDIASNNDEIVDDTNHIVEAIEDHENRLLQTEHQTKRLKKHVKQLTKEVMLNRNLSESIINAVAIKTIANSLARNLQDIQNGLYELLKNRLSPSLINLSSLEKAFKKLQNKLMQTGYRTVVVNAKELLQSEASFVSYSNGQIIVLLHVMLYTNTNILNVYEFRTMPIKTTINGTNIMLKPDKNIIAINNDMTLYSTFTSNELNKNCKKLGNYHYCQNNNILQRTNSKDCLLSLYRGDNNFDKSCEIELTKEQGAIIQLNSTSFLTYTTKKSQLHVSCINFKDGREVDEPDKLTIQGYNTITMNTGCKGTLNNFIFRTSLKFEDITFEIRLASSEININKILNCEDYEGVSYLNA